MKKTIIYTAFWLATAGIALTSCEDIFGGFLDKQPSNELTEEEVFSQWTTTREFHFDTYNFLRHGACRINNSWMDAATDLAETSYASGGTRTSFNIGNYYASSAATELTDTWEHYPGRISQPMARALYSRVMLYMASDRFRSESGISWQQAADAAQSFMTDYGTLYGLYTTDTDPKTCYTNAILKNAHDEKNNETIFWRNDVAVGWGAIYNDTPVGEGGNGGLCPSQNLVDMYDMANGQSPFSSYDETGAPVYNGTATPAINNTSGYKSNDPYSNRDPRLAATVLYNGVNWGNGIINVLKGQRDNPQGNANATPTGYYTRKYIPEVILNNNHTGSNYRNWIIIRYAEILLNYAEALNEAGGSRTDVLNAIQPLRDRVGMTAKLTDRSDLQTIADRRNFIRKERTVELAFEDHRAWDVRRWNVAEKALARPIYGMEITKENGKFVYTRKVAQNRVFTEKMYLYPIPEGEVWKTNIENNPGWNN